jgi:hypothetical protein
MLSGQAQLLMALSLPAAGSRVLVLPGKEPQKLARIRAFRDEIRTRISAATFEKCQTSIRNYYP